MPRNRSASFLRRFAQGSGIELEPTGFYVPPEDSTALRRAIEHLLDHPEEARRLGAAGRQTVERLLTVDLFAERVRHLVDAAAGREVLAPLWSPVPSA